ncbi:30S ribosomal protein S21 [Candidatus Roizmanbacteria bacterium CG_4_10_14_0_2_um_filter_36_35]|uniref:Small ribosomal subunit protein bS21 n=3 Tax=Candidatus Roizmaniibacteriota TaxID=1752723 RepID=A0A2M7BWV0_9BACT|nr:MAG: 30S ribosomal protein S21 [Candidatus Roizmanbacteria bacterium CG11_big_fil_rev_8_21_14_0_20_35_14]PIV11037.1 MAG: 30S ribosomal protein S21 [Candidatus Roizmanbacteria bacterium CG03_land_8_20_14_0_80_35_26]PIZ67004.1 MAG: 30S ribosomal protein S21 [Candidatus Roizmanbacteria bacterium CG_4_10_14_0_2_um_filter_36_35]PJC80393.1 MAG: 30S ribosomal protein S21 [Candidatus Roizmanbacteria bacterium CG_4_8_14_3_um_filter_36_12]
MVVITKKKGETKDALFRKFSRMFINEDIVTTFKKKQFYKKPSIVRKEEEKERRKNRYARKTKMYRRYD